MKCSNSHNLSTYFANRGKCTTEIILKSHSSNLEIHQYRCFVCLTGHVHQAADLSSVAEDAVASRGGSEPLP